MGNGAERKSNDLPRADAHVRTGAIAAHSRMYVLTLWSLRTGYPTELDDPVTGDSGVSNPCTL